VWLHDSYATRFAEYHFQAAFSRTADNTMHNNNNNNNNNNNYKISWTALLTVSKHAA